MSVERWKQIEQALGQGGPLPNELRLYLFEVVHELNWLADDTRLTPEHAARRIPEVIGITGAAIRAYREQRRAEGFGWLFDRAEELGIKRRGRLGSGLVTRKPTRGYNSR